jgi:hypothetical protein
MGDGLGCTNIASSLGKKGLDFMENKIVVGFSKLGEGGWIIGEGETNMFTVRLVVLVEPMVHGGKYESSAHVVWWMES